MSRQLNIDKSLVKNELVKKIKTRLSRTPDMEELRKQVRIPLFVYGTLKKGFANNRILDGADFLGNGHTVGTKYHMKDTGGFPVVFDEWGGVQKASIRGELYGVTVDHIIATDILENNGVMYQRKIFGFNFEEQEKNHNKEYPFMYAKAWMYVAVPSYWDGVKVDNVSTKMNPAHPTLAKKTFFEWKAEQGRLENRLHQYIRKDDGTIINLFDKSKKGEESDEERKRRNSAWMESYGGAMGFMFDQNDMDNWE